MIAFFSMSDIPRILILDNHDSFTYNLYQLIGSLGVSVDVTNDPEREIPSFTSYSGIVFSPGPGLPADFPMMMKLIHSVGYSKPILGICLGMQAIVTSFGGDLINMAQVNHGVTRSMFFPPHRDELFRGLTDGEQVGLYHSWRVDRDKLPAMINVTATSSDGLVLAISHVTYPLKGVQFHPESIMTPCG